MRKHSSSKKDDSPLEIRWKFQIRSTLSNRPCRPSRRRWVCNSAAAETVDERALHDERDAEERTAVACWRRWRRWRCSRPSVLVLGHAVVSAVGDGDDATAFDRGDGIRRTTNRRVISFCAKATTPSHRGSNGQRELTRSGGAMRRSTE
jgi:hypothetical protein